MRFITGNPYAEPASLAPAKPRPAPAPRKRREWTPEELKANAEARVALAARMRRADNPHDFD